MPPEIDLSNVLNSYLHSSTTADPTYTTGSTTTIPTYTTYTTSGPTITFVDKTEETQKMIQKTEEHMDKLEEDIDFLNRRRLTSEETLKEMHKEVEELKNVNNYLLDHINELENKNNELKAIIDIITMKINI